MPRRLAATVFASVLLAACGGEPTSATVPSLDDVSGGSTTTAAELDAGSALLDFSQCMRDEGVDIPDIGLDADGAPDLTDPAFGAIDVDSRAFADAFEVCQPILARVQAFRFAFDPEFQALLQDRLLGFSRCMRAAGVDDFPDPSGSLRPFPPEVADMLEDPALQATVEACGREAFTGLPIPAAGR